jgi:hypothetical protein
MMMNIFSKFIFTFSFILSVSVAFSQGKKDYEREVELGYSNLDDLNYMEALAHYKKAYAIDSNANMNFLIGYCYMHHPSQKHLAEKYLEKAILNINQHHKDGSLSEKGAPRQSMLWLAQAYHLDYKFDEAEKMFLKYEEFSKVKKDKVEYSETERLRKILETAKKRVAEKADWKIENMGDSINSEFPDYSPILSADERVLMFTHRGKESSGGELNKTADGEYFEDVFVSYQDVKGVWSKAKSIGPFVNSQQHEATVSISPDGQTLIIYKDDGGDGNLYYSSWNGTDWMMPVKYPKDINSEYWETHACLSVDGNILYFVSDRNGGYGGRDIYRAKKLPNGKWGKPQNLGPTVNTIYEDDAPFLHPNGVDLYFASKGHNTMGNFDVFKTKVYGEADSFAIPEALPYPINTTDDDVFFVVSPDKRRGYYASAHEDTTAFGEKDIYRIYLPPSEESPLVLFKGTVIPAPCEPLPGDLSVTVTDSITGEMFGTYRPQAGTGSFTLILPPEKYYVFSYLSDGLEFNREIVKAEFKNAYQEIRKEVKLKPKVLVADTSISAPCIEVTLNMSIVNTKNENKPASNAKITIKSSTETKTVYAEEDGTYKDYRLKADDVYEISAVFEGLLSEPQTVSTKGLKSSGVLNAQLIITGERVVPLVAEAPQPDKFVFFFKYNQNKLEESDDFKAFMSKVYSYAVYKGTINVSIHSSASQVPTKTFKTNEKLAETRAQKTLDTFKKALSDKTFDKSNITLKRLSALVDGPDYNNDFETNKAQYELYQFVEITVD